MFFTSRIIWGTSKSNTNRLNEEFVFYNFLKLFHHLFIALLSLSSSTARTWLLYLQLANILIHGLSMTSIVSIIFKNGEIVGKCTNFVVSFLEYVFNTLTRTKCIKNSIYSTHRTRIVDRRKSIPLRHCVIGARTSWYLSPTRTRLINDVNVVVR